LDQKRKVIDTVKERIRKVKEGRDEETALTTELNEALCKYVDEKYLVTSIRKFYKFTATLQHNGRYGF